MKSKIFLLITATLALQPLSTTACPTCVGRIYMDKNSKKPFFAKDFYQPKSKQIPDQKKTENNKAQQETAQRAANPFDELWSES